MNFINERKGLIASIGLIVILFILILLFDLGVIDLNSNKNKYDNMISVNQGNSADVNDKDEDTNKEVDADNYKAVKVISNIKQLALYEKRSSTIARDGCNYIIGIDNKIAIYVLNDVCI